MDWAEDYLSACLSGIPKSAYRNRLKSELADHLALLAGDLKTVGHPAEEARKEALRQMGDAAALNEGYWSEWLRQPERQRWDLSRFLFGCLIAGMGFLIGAALLLFGDTMLGLIDTIAGYRLHGAPPLSFLRHLSGAVLWAAAFIPNALFLRKAFRRRTRRAALISGGLLLSWGVGKGTAVLYLLAGYGSVSTEAMRMFAGSFDPLWFTWPLIALSLLTF